MGASFLSVYLVQYLSVSYISLVCLWATVFLIEDFPVEYHDEFLSFSLAVVEFSVRRLILAVCFVPFSSCL